MRDSSKENNNQKLRNLAAKGGSFRSENANRLKLTADPGLGKN